MSMKKVSLSDVRAGDAGVAAAAAAPAACADEGAAPPATGYVLPPLLWTQVKPRLRPAEVPEFKRVLGPDQILRNKELHVEASALAEIYTQYCQDSQISIQAVYAKRAAMPQPQAHGMLLSEISMLVDKLQATHVVVAGRGAPGSPARPSTPLAAVKSLAQDRQQLLWRMLQTDGPGRLGSPRRPGSADSPSRRSTTSLSGRGSPRRADRTVDRVKLLFTVDATMPSVSPGIGSGDGGAEGHAGDDGGAVREGVGTGSSGRAREKKREKKEKKRDKRDKKAKRAANGGLPPAGPSAAAGGSLNRSLNSTGGSAASFGSGGRDPFSRPTTASARPPSSQRPTSTASAPADIDGAGFGFNRLNLPLALHDALGGGSPGVEAPAEFSLDMEHEAVVALRAALEAEEEQLQSEVEFLQMALEGEVDNTAEALREASVAPVTTSELRAVSEELKEQWLSSSQSHSAHDLLASLGGGGGGGAEADVAVIHGPGGTGTTAAQPGPTGEESEPAVQPARFQRRGGSLRDKLRGTVSEARAEERYFS